jgi:multidrug resistance efflux pump
VPIAFSRSMRSLHADGRSRRAIWFLLIPVAVLAAWSTWFLKSHVAHYQVTDHARLQVDQAVHVIAEFPPTALGRIRTGQPGRFRSRVGGVPIRVTSVADEVHDGYVRVELAVDQTITSIPLQQGLSGTVEIQVENVSPATLLLRAAGQTP